MPYRENKPREAVFTRFGLRVGRSEDERKKETPFNYLLPGFHGNSSRSRSELSQWKQTGAPIHQHPSLLATLASCAGAPGRDRGLRSLSSVTCSRDRSGWLGVLVTLSLKVKARELWVRATLPLLARGPSGDHCGSLLPALLLARSTKW